MMRTNDDASAVPALSRRGFFTLAAALGLSTSASFWEGFFVRAYADEAGTTAYAIYVSKRWEVPVCFLDVSNTENPKSVVGATVAISSLYNGKVATGITDDLGVALIDITELAEPEPESDATVRTDYSFYGALVAEAEGFRTYSTGKLRIRGGEQLDAPTRPLDGKPYVLQATIDGWDIQHADATTFVATSNNPDSGHEAVVEIAGLTAPTEVSLYQESGARHSATISPVDGVASAKLTGQFFSTNASDAGEAFAPGEPIFISLASSSDGFNSMATAATCERGSSDAPIDETDEKAAGGSLSATSFLLEPNSISLIGIPEEFPVLGGGTFNFESILPAFPLSLAYDPTGHIVAGVGYAGTLHRKSSGNGVWQHRTFQDAKDEYRRSKDEWSNTFKRMRKNNDDARLLGDKVSRCGKLAPVSGFEMSFQCGGMIHMEYGDYLSEQGSADKFSGAAQLYAILAGEYSYIQPFVVLYVPLYVRFQVSAALRATIDVGVGVTKDEGKFHLSDGASFSLNLKPELAVTLGVGVADVVSVGVRGSGYLSAFMGVYFESPEEGKPNPRLSLEGGADVSVVLQAFMFKGSVGLYSFSGVIADNWAAPQAARLASGDGADASSSSGASGAYAMRLHGGGVGQPIPSPFAGNGGLLGGGRPSAAFSDNAVPVTASELMSSVEFTATPKRVVLRSNDADGALPPQHDLYSYEPARRDGRGLGAPSSGLQSLGSGGAVVAGGTMHEGAYSDPRLKVVVVDGVPWMLRILSVDYGTAESPQVRTRLSIARWVFDSGDGETLADGLWESAQVIDFEPVYGGVQVSEGQGGVSATPQRIDLYDYDFSVLSASDVDGIGATWADDGAVRVFLTSGTRNGVEAVGGAADQTVCTFLSIGKDFSIKTCRSFLDTYKNNFAKLPSDVLDVSTYTHSLITYPFVLSAGAGEENVTVIFGFCRMAASADALMSGPYYEVPATAAFDSAGAPIVSPASFTYATGGQNSKEEFLTVLGDVKHSVSAGIIEHNISGQGTVTIGCHYVTSGSDGRVAKAFSLARRTAATSNNAETGDVRLHAGTSASNFVYPWTSEEGCAVLSAANGKLEIRSINGAGRDVSVTPLSLDNSIDLSSFALDPHSGMLYYATARVGDERGHKEDGALNDEATAVSDYRIWATRCITVAGKTGFMKPFPLLQTEYPIDSLEYLDLGDSYGFVVNSIQSMADSTSRIALYRLPYLKRVTLMDFESVNRYVCAGEEEAFRITVRNDGNLSVSSFSVVVAAGGEEYQLDFDLAKTQDVVPLPGVRDVVGSATVASNAARDNAAASNSVIAETAFDLATEAGLLNPGVIRSYEFTWRVPDGLSGETPLTVRVLEDGSAPEGSQSSNGVSSGEGSRFASGALFASAVNGDIPASSIDSSVLFRVPSAALDEDGSNVPGGPDDGSGESGGQGEGSGNDASGESGGGASGASGDVIPGGSGGLSATGDDLSSTAMATLLAGLGLAGMGIAAKKLGDEDGETKR